MTRYCSDCGVAFEARGSWMRRCWDCWRVQKVREEERARQDAIDDAWTAGFERGVKVGRDLALNADFIRQLVVLCHPDRHPPERFSQANAVTAALLGMAQNGGVR